MKQVLAVLLMVAGTAQAQSTIVCKVQNEEPKPVNTFVNDWYDRHAVRYWKDIDGVVHLEGMFQKQCCNPPASHPEVVFVLPPGYRPEYDTRFSVPADFGPGNSSSAKSVWILPSGEVLVEGVVLWASISGITFRGFR